jgi:hypothetical protein
MDLPAKIRLGTHADGRPVEFDVVAPTSHASMLDIAALQHTSRHRAGAAAVALCCPMLARQLRVRYTSDASTYGGAVIDAFAATCAEHKIRASVLDLVNAGYPLISEFVTAIVSAEEVIATEGFTDPTPAGSTS